MGSIRREIVVHAADDWVWAALCDFGAVAGLFPGVLTDSRAEGDGRVVTFADGQKVRERIVDVDDAAPDRLFGPGRRLRPPQCVDADRARSGRCQPLGLDQRLPADDARAAIEPLIDAGTAAFAKRWNG
ncbi:hypothetical protein [Sphingosinicella sp.]|uniref:hypothetical protein n=1 Tax=Sphingosinicella sp. TaxID=1917971 RepID=UPI004037EF04